MYDRRQRVQVNGMTKNFNAHLVIFSLAAVLARPRANIFRSLTFRR
ncbi:MAG: hypothetical protein QOE55_6837 [Acidobacteriaceae bacterium]|nr:hypothetical protein [Acidobacteriaceae bacterium]